MDVNNNNLYRRLSSSVAVLPLLGLVSCGSQDKPNIVFILADDYGWNETSATGSQYYETPNIDRIASRGINFTQGYSACQVSSPSRASLMTGLYTTRHGVTDWIGEYSGEDWRSMGRHNKVLPADYSWNLNVDRFKCLPQILHDGGYKTAMFGKWHLGSSTTPEMAGFDINVGGYDAGHPRNGYFSPYNNPKLTDGPAGENLSIRLAEETNRFLEEQASQKKKSPFFVYLSFYAVHAPIQTTEERWRYFRDKAVEMGIESDAFAIDRTLPVRLHQDNPVYAGLVQQMDISVGMVLDKLEELKLDKNTIVIFTSDNGGVSSGDAYSSSMYPLRGGKGRQWEGGIRVPLFVSIPKLNKPFDSCDTPVCTVDMMPTILDYAGLECPDDIDGVSIRPLLEGRQIKERALFWHYPHYGNQGGEPSSIIRDGDFKLIYYHEDGRYELYNLTKDRGETSNIIEENKAVAEQMKAKLSEWLVHTGARMPVLDTEYDEATSAAYWKMNAEKILKSQTELRNKMLEDNWQPNKDWWGSKTED